MDTHQHILHKLRPHFSKTIAQISCETTDFFFRKGVQRIFRAVLVRLVIVIRSTGRDNITFIEAPIDLPYVSQDGGRNHFGWAIVSYHPKLS